MLRESASSLPKMVEGSTFFGLDLPIVFEVALVADEELDDVLVSELIDLCEPVLDVLEGLPVGDVVHQDNSMSTLVI